MRLLSCNGTGNFSLTKDLIGDDVLPPYAILSHTWQEGQEVTFGDLVNNTGKSKAGYDKIRLCAELAEREGLHYFWVDTCCINKSEYVEVQDAINSMFRWYEKAAVCYVYLSDVSVKCPLESRKESEMTWEAAFRKSRWFTRGWTLQELLAPKDVRFYSREGEWLGDKLSLQRQIREVTGIALPVLQGAPLYHYSVEERLSWASNRRTTRKEDKSYSLLGVFGIHMVLNYGEGEENAFKRLHEEIEKPRVETKMLEWLSLLDSSAKHKAISALRQPGTSDWFFREQAARDWINHGDFIWLHGPSGSGKTVLISAIIDHLRTLLSTKPVTKAVAYHYCDFSNHPSLDATRIIGSLVRQLVQHMDVIPPVLRELYYRSLAMLPQADTFIRLLHEIANQAFEVTYIIIDGIDECPNRSELLENIRELRSLAWSKRLCILLSSRPEYDIRQELLSEAQFGILPTHVQDSLEIHARSELSRMSRLQRLPMSYKNDLVQNLVLRADGMYRWMQCQLDNLREVRTRKALEEVLETLPDGLYKTYDRILEGIKVRDYDLVLRLFKWLIGAERPLSLEELAESIAIDPDKDFFDPNERLLEAEEVLALCSSMIRVQENGTVVLAHFSVKEYLLSNRLTHQKHDIARFALEETSSKRHVVECLLTYFVTITLHIQDLTDRKIQESEFPLLAYARILSTIHFRNFDMIRGWVEEHFATKETEFRRVVQLLNYTKPPAPYAANYGDAWFMQRVLQYSFMCFWNGYSQQEFDYSSTFKPGTSKLGNDIAEQFLEFQLAWQDPKNLENVLQLAPGRPTPSPLCTAAYSGFRFAAQYLLDNGAFVDGLPVPYCTGIPILRAMADNLIDMFQLLIDNNANLNLSTYGTNVGTVLEQSLAYNTDRKLFENLLRNNSVNVNLVGPRGVTIHYWAKHNPTARRILQQVTPTMAGNYEDRADYCDEEILYSTILHILQIMKGRTTVRYHYGQGLLACCLFMCGPEYHSYAAVFEEQGIVSKDPVIHAYGCDSCVANVGGFIRGTRYKCIYCIDTDLCADCYQSWEQSNGGMELCKGHEFYKVPRTCWYGFKEGIVTEDGKTLSEVINYLDAQFTTLLATKRTKPGTVGAAQVDRISSGP